MISVIVILIDLLAKHKSDDVPIIPDVPVIPDGPLDVYGGLTKD